MELKITKLVFLLIGISSCTSVKTIGVYYVFGADGIDVVDPDTQSIVKHFASSQTLCTKGSSRFARGNCSFGTAVNVNNKYIVVTESRGNRVHFIDIALQKRVETIKTEPYPYDIYYLPWSDEIWVHTWGSRAVSGVGGTFDVISVKKKQKTHNAIKAHIKPGWTHGFMVTNPSLQKGKYAYVSHYANSGIHKLDLVNKKYSDFVNVTQNCTGTMQIAYSSRINHVFFQCLKGGKQDGIFEVDAATDKIVKKWDIKGRPYISPDGRFIISLYSSVNETSGDLLNSTVYVIEVPNTGMTRLYKALDINGGVSQVAFGPKDGNRWVFISLLYASHLVALNLESLSKAKVEMKNIPNVGTVVTGPGRHAVSRDITYSADWQKPANWLISVAPADRSVALIYIKDFVNDQSKLQVKMVDNIENAKFSVWVGPSKSESNKGASVKQIPFKSIVSFFSLMVVIFLIR